MCRLSCFGCPLRVPCRRDERNRLLVVGHIVEWPSARDRPCRTRARRARRARVEIPLEHDRNLCKTGPRGRETIHANSELRVRRCRARHDAALHPSAAPFSASQLRSFGSHSGLLGRFFRGHPHGRSLLSRRMFTVAARPLMGSVGARELVRETREPDDAG